VQSQQEFQQRVNQMTGGGGVPGMSNQPRNAPTPARQGGR
jgi:hypothetical protein